MIPNLKIATKLKNFNGHGSAIGFIGNSVLIARNSKKLNCKLIDFSHAYKVNSKSNIRYINMVHNMCENNTRGLENLLMFLYLFIFLKHSKLYNKPRKV